METEIGSAEKLGHGGFNSPKVQSETIEQLVSHCLTVLLLTMGLLAPSCPSQVVRSYPNQPASDHPRQVPDLARKIFIYTGK